MTVQFEFFIWSSNCTIDRPNAQKMTFKQRVLYFSIPTSAKKWANIKSMQLRSLNSIVIAYFSNKWCHSSYQPTEMTSLLQYKCRLYCALFRVNAGVIRLSQSGSDRFQADQFIELTTSPVCGTTNTDASSTRSCCTVVCASHQPPIRLNDPREKATDNGRLSLLDVLISLSVADIKVICRKRRWVVVVC